MWESGRADSAEGGRDAGGRETWREDEGNGYVWRQDEDMEMLTS